ncbi:MAG TPA: ATP-binding cassette domain-containing protein [Sporichthya sp.]|nr:ATP-binding cassette domain-containing protein [Sporichthya sp.]
MTSSDTWAAATPVGATIVARDLTKTYRKKLAVDGLSFSVFPGRVTGFLGPNGAGKSTTLRLLLGLDRPDRGQALIAGRPYVELTTPLRTVGALLEARAVHGGRTARAHLTALAQSQRLPLARVDEVIGLVGLDTVADKRSGGFSLGMGQRLGIACALLGDPQVLLLDEPLNGLDPEGIVWLRTLLQRLAAEGRTVLISSHLMNEMAVTADHLIVVGGGRLLADCATTDLLARGSGPTVRVAAPDLVALSALAAALGGTVQLDGPGALLVHGVPAERLGEAAGARGLILHELAPQQASLEAAFMELTRGAVEYRPSDYQPTQKELVR